AAASDDGSVYLLDAHGKVIWRDATGHAAYAVTLSANAGVLVLGLDNGVAGAINVAGALAGSAAGQRALYERIALGALAALAVLVVCALYIRASPRRLTAFERPAAALPRGGRRGT